jgi:hypothetical protein
MWRALKDARHCLIPWDLSSYPLDPMLMYLWEWGAPYFLE